MKRSTALLFTGLLASEVCAQQQTRSFQQEQFAHPRVQAAAKEKDAAWRKLFAETNVQFPPRRLLLLAFKREAALEIWASDGDSQKYVLLKSFHIWRAQEKRAPSGALETDKYRKVSMRLIGSTRRAIFI